jgi:hypothetical protein
MLDQFLSQDPDLRPGELKRIGEQDVDVAPIINQFQQSLANEHLKAKRIDAQGFFNEEPIPCR